MIPPSTSWVVDIKWCIPYLLICIFQFQAEHELESFQTACPISIGDRRGRFTSQVDEGRVRFRGTRTHNHMSHAFVWIYDGNECIRLFYGRIAEHTYFVWTGPIVTLYKMEAASLCGVRLKPPLEMLDGSFNLERRISIYRPRSNTSP